MIDKSYLDNLIIGRVEPHIYAFTTNTIPNYLKVGDTYRPVAVRLREWQDYFPELKKQYEHTAKINDDVYFRDFAVHQFLETDKRKVRLLSTDIADGIYYSKEFFKNVNKTDVEEAIVDIENNYKEKTNKYQFYNAESRLPETYTYPRTETYGLRPNQEKTVAAFHAARENGHKNLLMYAVMRFGKSFTAMCCALDMNARLVVVVSGKADVKREWQKTVQSHVKFEDYTFLTSDELIRNNHEITDTLGTGKKVVVFLTLQDLQGNIIKDKHQEVFGQNIDLLLVDETHFGARADKYGAVLNTKNYQPDIKLKNDDEDFVDTEEADTLIKVLNAETTIHLSGTPYRILMGSEFKKDDIIAFYQFTDIIADKEEWDKEHVLDDQYKEWDNPYYGFPQMVRFAFHPSERARRRLEELKKAGTTYVFSALLKPKSIKKDSAGKHKEFEYKDEVLDLFEVIDGSKEDKNLLGFLDYDKIKDGKMCRHIVIVLPYCASCDALEALIKSNAEKFCNLQQYEIINISGVEKPNAYKSTDDIKKAIRDCEAKGKKTITLTVNRMLTGSTVPEWDTMIYLKDTASPQEYDQAIFRLQNQYIKTFVDKQGDKIKFNMKPQTLLVDFDPNRMFVMQETKSKIYNVNVDTGGNAELEKRIQEELRISPIVTLNSDKIEEVKAVDILKVVSNYQKDKGIREEAIEIPTDLSILNDEEIRKVIDCENEIGSKAGLSTPAHEAKDSNDEGEDYKFPENIKNTNSQTPVSEGFLNTEDEQKKQINSLKKKIQSYYARILLFAYLTKDNVISISDIITSIDADDNCRIAKNLGLSKDILSRLFDRCNKFVLSELDYKIQDLNELSHTAEMQPADKANIAISKFGKLGDAIVITPSDICDDMVALLPDDFMLETANKGGHILDIAGTSGEYAVALQKRLSALGIEEEKIANMIFTIPKSSICYELIRKLYEMLGLNIENIASEFVATDLIEFKNDRKIDYDKIRWLLTQNKPFNTIKLTDDFSQGGENMITFDAVVGNPPYQQEVRIDKSAHSTTKTNVFHYFQIAAINIAKGYTSLIYPGVRWMHQSGKGLSQFGYNLINDLRLDRIVFYPVATDVFVNVEVPDGITVVLMNKHKKDAGFLYEYVSARGRTCLYRDNPGKDLLVLDPLQTSIVEKIVTFVKRFKLQYLHNSILPRSLFGIESDFIEKRSGQAIPYIQGMQIDYKKKIKLLANDKSGPAGRTMWFVVDRNTIKQNTRYISEWQVIVSSAHPGGQDHRSNMISIVDNNSAFGRSRIALKSFTTYREAKNFYKYANTNFVKYALLLSDESLTSLAKYVPDLLNYKNSSNLVKFEDPIEKINIQLYELLGFTSDEIDFIESMVKDTE